MNDELIEEKLDALRRDIQNWAAAKEVGDDLSFSDWITHFGSEPQESPCVLWLNYDGEFSSVMSGGSHLEDELFELVHERGFLLEPWDHVSSAIYSNDERYDEFFRDYFEWKWICHVVREDYSDLYHELFDYFTANPERLHQLHHRDFERLLDAVFRNNGYDSILGPGSGDGGVDLRLYHKDAIGDIVTLVQAKRYGDTNPISLEAVSALSGVVEDQRANRGLFVTTSRFLPSAREFALRQAHRIELATSDDVSKWCNLASSRIVRDKSQLVDKTYLSQLITTQRDMALPDRVLRGSTGYNCTRVSFCLLLKETRNAALLMEIPSVVVSGDEQLGACIPDLASTSVAHCCSQRVFRAKKSKSPLGTPGFWGNHIWYTSWDGQPAYFNSD